MPEDDGDALGELLLQVARLQRRRWRELLLPWDLSPSQGRALRVVCDGDQARVSDVADRLRIAPRSATEVADTLEARGLIQRGADRRDRRVVLLRATPAGRRVLAEVDEARAADSRALFDRLSAPDRATLARLLHAVADAE